MTATMNVNKDNDSGLVKKKIVNPGSGEIPYPDGTKVLFHVVSEALSDPSLPTWPPSDKVLDCQLIDNSRDWKQPVELILGKKFKLEVWEECINTMKKGEVAEFIVDKQLLSTYPVVAQTLRKALSATAGPPVAEGPRRCCGMGFKDGLGHQDLDQLVAAPRHMKFTIELLSAELPGSYSKQYWEMSEEERHSSITDLQQRGNVLYKQGSHQEARDLYKEAIGRLDNLMLKEKPNDVDWLALNTERLPLLLNYSQCELLLGEYYSVVEHCSSVLLHEPDNVKALFRRGKAAAALCSGEMARADLGRCCSLDPSIAASCKKVLGTLAQQEKIHNESDKKRYANMFSAREEN